MEKELCRGLEEHVPALFAFAGLGRSPQTDAFIAMLNGQDASEKQYFEIVCESALGRRCFDV